VLGLLNAVLGSAVSETRTLDLLITSPNKSNQDQFISHTTNARVYNKVNEVQYAKIQTCANIAVKRNITHIQTVRGQ